VTRYRSAVLVAFFIALHASAQYIPPIPKTIKGQRGLHRTSDIPLPSPKQQWVRARSPHFLILSGAGEWRTREVVDEIEKVAAALHQVDPHFAAEGELTRLILFGKTKDSEPYFDLLVGRPKMPGAFVASPDGVGTMIIDGSRTDADRTLFHELVHNLLANSGSHLPLWLEEGTADYFSTAYVLGSVVRFGARVPEHFAQLRNRPLMPLRELFEVQPASEIGNSGFFYAESYSVVDWMMRADTAAFYRLVADVDRGRLRTGNPVCLDREDCQSSMEALQREFKVDPSIIERNLQGPQLRPLSRVTLHVDMRQLTTSVEPVPRATAIVELANFLAAFEATRGDAERFLSTVIADDPKNGPAIAAMAALRARDRKYDDAAQLYEQALQLMPDDTSIALSFAESLLGNSIGPFSGTVEIESGAAPRFRRARQLASDALGKGADTARANAVIGSSYLTEDDVAPGIAALQTAHQLRPRRYDVSLNLYALLLRAGQLEDAATLYDEITAAAHSQQAIFAAKAVFVRERLALTNRLLKENRMPEAIEVMKELIEVTPDARAKADLQRQLAHLEDVSDANKQIMAYNDAVGVANQGDPRKALKMLDDLLATATDASVVRDAMAFKKQLQKRIKGMPRS
jgi:tetratricopeptide (TPR) repeat protein